MAIVPLRKVTLYGQAARREEVLRQLQKLGCIHLVNLRGADAAPPEHPFSADLQEAIRFLRNSPLKRDPVHHPRGFRSRDVTAEVLEIKRQRDALRSERDELGDAIEKLQPWGDFTLPSPSELGGLQLWFYALPHHQLETLRQADLAWRLISSDADLAYVAVVGAAPPQDLPTAPLELDRRPLSTLRARIAAIDESLEELRWQRSAQTRWLPLLQHELDRAQDETARAVARNLTFADSDLFALQGWIPADRTAALERLAREQTLALVVDNPQVDDRPPTLLENSPRIHGAEKAVTFYITPEYRAWDPTWVVFASFSLFFAMIVSDAGYGLMLLAGIGFFSWKRKPTDGPLPLRNFLLAIAVTTIVYGMLVGSYFGLPPSPGSWLARWQIKAAGASLMASENQGLMMLIAVVIGVLHLTLANLITAWQRRGTAQSWSAIGWAAALVSGFVLGAAESLSPDPVSVFVARILGMEAEAARTLTIEVSSGVLAVSAVTIFLFSSAQPLWSRSPRVWLQRMLDGLLGLASAPKAFGDVLSYLRLFALGLASAQLAVTFNELARGAASQRGLGLLLAALILAAGHSINLLLAVVGGVVHGLRLNCIEFFGWSLTDEGYPFQAFRRKAGD